jgi:hypothetical protein
LDNTSTSSIESIKSIGTNCFNLDSINHSAILSKWNNPNVMISESFENLQACEGRDMTKISTIAYYLLDQCQGQISTSSSYHCDNGVPTSKSWASNSKCERNPNQITQVPSNCLVLSRYSCEYSSSSSLKVSFSPILLLLIYCFF